MSVLYVVAVQPGRLGRSFPIDMLRYDQAIPESEQDSVNIASSMHPRSVSQRTIRVVMPRQPTMARWESFGWKVIAVDERRV
jgi:hypothetical protein